MKAQLLIAAIAGALWGASAQAVPVFVEASGTVYGTTTTTVCGPLPQCVPSVAPSSFNYFLAEDVDTADFVNGPVSYNYRFGYAYFGTFEIALLGVDQWGNYNFQGQNLSIFGTSNPNACSGSSLSCTYDMSSWAAATFAITQIRPAPIPEPATWAMMLMGLLGLGLVLGRRSALSTS